jgi:methylmalonyl-CoA/ethylmalonyl-CoA epimerase
MTIVLDHFAIGTPVLADGWDLFGGLLGGTWAYGGDSAGYWWGQVRFASGPKVELLTPTGGPDAAFLERFLAAHGAGPHHLNFAVDDIEDALARIGGLGIEPVGVNLGSPRYKEAFLHPRSAHGIVIQLAQQDSPPRGTPPSELPEPGPASRFDLIEHHVSDLGGATELFRDGLGGEVEMADDHAVELAWPGGSQIRLVREDGLARGGALHHVRFARADGTFSDDDREQIAASAKRLGVAIELAR